MIKKKRKKINRNYKLVKFPTEASPIGQIHPFCKMAVNFEPLMEFWCPSGFRKLLITMT